MLPRNAEDLNRSNDSVCNAFCFKEQILNQQNFQYLLKNTAQTSPHIVWMGFLFWRQNKIDASLDVESHITIAITI